MYMLIVPLITLFRITVFSLPHFPHTFLDKNISTLMPKIDRMLEFVGRNDIFGSLLELLPGMACSVKN